jgi:hypothetical protein
MPIRDPNSSSFNRGPMDLESTGKPRYADFYETEKIMRIWY